MILGSGIDMVAIERFKEWNTKPTDQLSRIFSTDEIAYCLEIPTKSAERFAVRFAAKEAFYKAYCSWHTNATVPIITACKAVSVAKCVNNVPQLLVNWQALHVSFEPVCHVSLTHTAEMALALVILEKL